MAKTRTYQRAGSTRKSHQSRKTAKPTPVQGSSSLGSAAVRCPPPNPLVDTLSLNTALTASERPVVDKKATEPTDSPVPQEVAPEKQWWYRPPDSKARKIAARVMVHRAAGRNDSQIAKLIKSTEGTVRQYVYLARRNGWVDEDDEPVDIEAELAQNIDRKIVRNISASLDGQMTNWQTHEMTIAAAKGRRIFNDGAKGADSPTGMPVVAIQVIMPPIGAADQRPEIPESQMGGVPAYVEGDVEGEVSSVGQLQLGHAGGVEEEGGTPAV